MHNIISRGQLDEWKHFASTISLADIKDENVEVLNDYFECLIECAGDTPHCKRICREILT
jgi:hypothetical protein|nr:hypothetical protein [uncultured Mediterranean phage uvMED]BAR29521.1 hypothetical protein [uncultured Mediterranean phage uvMED]